MKFIELFAGIGGFRYGLENCNIRPDELANSKRPEERNNIKNKLQQREYMDCVYANEFNKYAAQIYERHYEKPDTRDIREVSAEEIPDHDLLTAGFPCQSFSIAGKRGGFEDTRGTLFFEIARIAKQKQPRLLLLENVKGLLSHDKGKTFGTILNTLDELGYDLQWQVLNSKDFGVPQNRERVFIVGHLRGTSRPEVFPIGGTATKDNAVFIDESQWRREEKLRVYDGVCNTLNTAGGGGHIPLTTRKVANTIDANYYKGINSNPGHASSNRGIEQCGRIRRLTPVECERLQGFPDDWTKYGIEDGKQVEISDTQRYKCLGNAVTTNVVTAIGERLLDN
jgi:DNA (cytosine-5)-methyltransferase 1